MKLPVLQATVFHQVLNSPLSNFIQADHGEETNRRLLEKESKVEEKLKENDKDQIGFPNFGLGEMEKKFKESMSRCFEIWQIICNLFVSIQIMGLAAAFLITKIRQDIWLWQLGTKATQRSKRSIGEKEDAE
ncbi:unnamed protein product [Meloidogyne enterolobii]|uniref:Uncharacterized protein n=1 Tax=Meloidogyne enterolobii TaxID=390850 RepID=A0ACB1ADS6_MELEN